MRLDMGYSTYILPHYKRKSATVKFVLMSLTKFCVFDCSVFFNWNFARIRFFAGAFKYTDVLFIEEKNIRTYFLVN